jgi:hypothetical protein
MALYINQTGILKEVKETPFKYCRNSNNNEEKNRLTTLSQ